jgi:multiple sugar transport system ATP-binding protein
MKRYEGAETPAVRDVSFTVADREFLVLLGPSGCGKSTVLRMIAGLEPISAGTVSIDGRVVNQVPAKARDIAMVFQSYALYPHMTVFTTLRSAAAAVSRGGSSAGCVTSPGGWGSANSSIASRMRSGGRSASAQRRHAIVRDLKVFLFDEPLSNLDAALRASARNDLIRQQREIGTTSITSRTTRSRPLTDVASAS